MTISFDKVADIYDKTRGFPEHTMEKIVEVLQEELKDQNRILDVGVGTGRFARPLQEIGFEVVGIDISEKMLGKAYERNIQNLLLGDACTLPFKDSSFDATITVHILHLIKDWKSALREITRATRGSLLTIVREREDYHATPTGAYKEIVEKLGYSYEHPGLGEWRLSELVKPKKKAFIISYDSNVNESISSLNNRVFSYQWKVPDEMHEKAMTELTRQFAGKSKYPNEISLWKWDIGDIEEFLNLDTTQNQEKSI